MRRGRPRKDGSGDATDIHIIMQLRKTITLSEHNIEFRNGDKLVVKASEGAIILNEYDKLDNYQKFDYQDYISFSKENFQKSLQNLLITL